MSRLITLPDDDLATIRGSLEQAERQCEAGDPLSQCHAASGWIQVRRLLDALEPPNTGPAKHPIDPSGVACPECCAVAGERCHGAVVLYHREREQAFRQATCPHTNRLAARCIRCGDGPPVRLRRRDPAEVAAYFEGALAALRMVRERSTSGLLNVEIAGLIALYESALSVDEGRR